MLYKEHVRESIENVISSIEEYGVQRNKDGSKFVYSPFKNLEEWLEYYEHYLDDPCEELEDYDDLSDEICKSWEEEGRKQIVETYEQVKAARISFLGEEEDFS